MDIGLDFDGTSVTHEYPNIGRDIGAVPVLKALVQNGHRLILNTMRSGRHLMDAVAWYRANGIHLSGINVNPEQHLWTTSPKVQADIYIDDAALGIPLIHTNLPDDRPFVDWDAVAVLLIERGILPPDYAMY